MNGVFYVYRYFDQCGCLLYIGQTQNPLERRMGHCSKAPWYKFVRRYDHEEHSSRLEARTAEAAAIAAERPAFNGKGRPLVAAYLDAHKDIDMPRVRQSWWYASVA